MQMVRMRPTPAVDVPDGLAEFCRREHPRLVGAISLYCGDGLLAEELAQDALEVACRRWAEVRTMGSPEAWVHRVAMNLANSRFRRRAAERRANARMLGGDVQVDVDVADAVALRREVSLLPTRQRRIVVLRFYLGFTVAQTASVLGMTPAAVKASTHRAVARLRGGFLDPDESEATHAG